MNLKPFIARLYRRLPLPYLLQAWIIRRLTPSYLVGVAGVIFNPRGQILLLEHIFHRHYTWGLPGGWMNRGESPEETLRRELREEVGLQVEIETLLAIEPDLALRQAQLQIGYLCRTLATQEPPTRLSYEILSARWVAPDALPGPLPPFHHTLIARALARQARPALNR